MGNFCPHAAASPKSVREYEYIVYSCTIGDDRGGEVYLHFGRSAHLRGFIFLLKKAGSVPKEKKNECDGKTTNLVVAKKKGENRLTSIIFYECPPLHMETQMKLFRMRQITFVLMALVVILAVSNLGTVIGHGILAGTYLAEYRDSIK